MVKDDLSCSDPHCDFAKAYDQVKRELVMMNLG